MRQLAEFKIRSFHTDAFGHVNNARYMEFLEEARWQYAEQIGLVELLDNEQLGFIIMDLRIRFRTPIFEGETISISTGLTTLGSTSGEVIQKVTKQGQQALVTHCAAQFILVDRKIGRAMDIEGEIRDRLLASIEPKAPK